MKTINVFALTGALGVTYGGVVGSPSSSVLALIALVTDINPSVSNSYSSPSYYVNGTHPDYPDCDAPLLSYIADGFCDGLYNNALCGWDGGDCCECTCLGTGYYDCGSAGYNCRDIDAPLVIADCNTTEPFPIPQVTTCPQDIPVKWVVQDTTDATLLAETVLCSRGEVLEVEWRGHVDVATTIHVLDGTSLHITGLYGAVADGGGAVQIIHISNASLYLNNVTMTNGFGTVGGAIIAVDGSELFVKGVTFSSNTAQTLGGSIYLASSNAELVFTNFDSNGAEYGGAMFLLNSIMIARGYTSFTSNIASGDGGALFIARSSYVGLNMQSIFPATSLYTGVGYNSTYSSWFNDYTYIVPTAYFGPEIEVDWLVIDDSGETVFADNSAGE